MLAELDGQMLGPYRLQVSESAPERKSGWTGFGVAVLSQDQPPAKLAEGIRSVGGRGVAPWIELTRYRPESGFPESPSEGREDLGDAFLSRLGRFIPPTGHLMLACDGRETGDTYRQLMRGLPPAATPLGIGLVRAGFPRVRFFYVAEGGWEGSQKLWAERPADDATARAWMAETATTLRKLLAEGKGLGSRERLHALVGELEAHLRPSE